MKLQPSDLRGTYSEPPLPQPQPTTPNDQTIAPNGQSIVPNYDIVPHTLSIPLDHNNAADLEKLEGQLAQGKRAYLIRFGLGRSLLIVAITAVYLRLMNNPYWYWLPTLYPFYALIGLYVATSQWFRIPSQIADLRAGKSNRLPPDLREALWLISGGTIALLIAAIVWMEIPNIEQEFLVMLMISGVSVAIWGLTKYTRCILRTPQEKRSFAKGNLLIAILLWFSFLFVFAVSTLCVFKEPFGNLILRHSEYRNAVK